MRPHAAFAPVRWVPDRRTASIYIVSFRFLTQDSRYFSLEIKSGTRKPPAGQDDCGTIRIPGVTLSTPIHPPWWDFCAIAHAVVFASDRRLVEYCLHTETNTCHVVRSGTVQ